MVKGVRVRDRDRIPGPLAATIQKLGFILHEGDERPRFNVLQDKKALRDLALLNARNPSRRTILVTFDKRLLQAVRLLQAWNEPYADCIAVESCQTFWIWFLTSIKRERYSSSSGALRAVMDDLRRRSELLLNAGPHHRITGLSHKATLTTLLSKYDYMSGAFADDESYKLEVISRAKQTLDECDEREAKRDSRSMELIRKISMECFREVRNLLPSFELLTSDVLDSEKVILTFLDEHGLDKADLFDTLNEQIQQHAKASLRLLGASTLMAPRTARAIYEFSSVDKLRPPSRVFIHRVPLPIQSDICDLGEVIKLVTANAVDLEVQYDRLLEVATLTGAISDLISAYVFSCGGMWAEAEDICRGSLDRYNLFPTDESTVYEIRLLLAGILRIHWTNETKLSEAEQLLSEACASKAIRPRADRQDIRIRLERLAIRVNRSLIDCYRSALAPRYGAGADTSGSKRLINDLLRVKQEINSCGDATPPLVQKLNANININYCLVRHFISSDSVNVGVAESNHKLILHELSSRIFKKQSRISYFEEIVGLYALSRDCHLLGLDDLESLNIQTLLRTRLSRVLQKDVKTNEFEYWVYSEILRRLNELA